MTLFLRTEGVCPYLNPTRCLLIVPSSFPTYIEQPSDILVPTGSFHARASMLSLLIYLKIVVLRHVH